MPTTSGATIGLAAGLLLGWTALLRWFFFGPRQSVAARSAGGVQELEVVVQGGYSPGVITVRRGMPVRLKFRRQETAACSERVVFPNFNITKRLPEHAITVVEFTPEEDGTYSFTCGMGMYKGTLVVKRGEAP